MKTDKKAQQKKDEAMDEANQRSLHEVYRNRKKIVTSEKTTKPVSRKKT